MKYTTVIWNRILGITMTLDNYMKARASEDKDIQDKLKTAHLTCMLRM